MNIYISQPINYPKHFYLKTEATFSPETLVHTRKTTLFHIPEDRDEGNDYCQHKLGALKC
jgi:hypothetical protein